MHLNFVRRFSFAFQCPSYFISLLFFSLTHTHIFGPLFLQLILFHFVYPSYIFNIVSFFFPFNQEPSYHFLILRRDWFSFSHDVFSWSDLQPPEVYLNLLWSCLNAFTFYKPARSKYPTVERHLLLYYFLLHL